MKLIPFINTLTELSSQLLYWVTASHPHLGVPATAYKFALTLIIELCLCATCSCFEVSFLLRDVLKKHESVTAKQSLTKNSRQLNCLPLEANLIAINVFLLNLLVHGLPAMVPKVRHLNVVAYYTIIGYWCKSCYFYKKRYSVPAQTR